MKINIVKFWLASAILIASAPAWADLVADESESDQATVATTNTGNVQTAFLIRSALLCPDAITSAGSGTVAGYKCITSGQFFLDFSRCTGGCR